MHGGFPETIDCVRAQLQVERQHSKLQDYVILSHLGLLLLDLIYGIPQLEVLNFDIEEELCLESS